MNSGPAGTETRLLRSGHLEGGSVHVRVGLTMFAIFGEHASYSLLDPDAAELSGYELTRKLGITFPR